MTKELRSRLRPSLTDRVWLRPTVIVFVRRGTVQWVASNEPKACILVLDGDSQDPHVPVDCRKEEPIPLEKIESGFRQTVVRTLGPGVLSRPSTQPPVTYTCGSGWWRIEEKDVIDFDSVKGQVQSIATIDHCIWCARCSDRPLNAEAVKEAYLACQQDRPVIGAAIEVVKCRDSDAWQDVFRRLALCWRRWAMQPSEDRQRVIDLLRKLVRRGHVLYGVTKLVNSSSDSLVSVYVIAKIGRGPVALHSIARHVAKLLDLPYHPERDTVQVAPTELEPIAWLAEQINLQLGEPGHLRGVAL